jgi:hypothetical protein
MPRTPVDVTERAEDTAGSAEYPRFAPAQIVNTPRGRCSMDITALEWLASFAEDEL